MVEDANWADAPKSDPKWITINMIETKESEKFFKTVNWLWKALGVVALIYIAAYSIGYGLDSTDVNPFNRSGMSLHVDNMTGCEYLGAAKGGLIPRVNANGMHMGCRPLPR